MLIYNYLKNLKQKKTKKLKNIQNLHQYFYFCNYTDLTSHEIIGLKTSLKVNNVNFYFIKNKLFNSSFNLGGKGSLFVLYFSDFENYCEINKILEKSGKITPLLLLNGNKAYSGFKLQNLKQQTVLPFVLKKFLNSINVKLMQIKI